MEPAESLVEHADRLTGLLGRWPSFHDAEVVELHLWRGDVDPDRESYVFPVLTVRVHLCDLTANPEKPGHLLLKFHTMVTLRFHDVDEDIQLTGFNHQNQIFGLSISKKERPEGPSPYLAVEFEHGFGMGATLKCRRAEVVSAVPCTKEEARGNWLDVP